MPGPDTQSAQLPDVPGAASRLALDSSLVRGLGWTGAAKAVSQVVSWGATLLVARLLSPADYGILGMAQVYVGFVQLVNEMGLGSAVIQQQSLSDDALSRLGGLLSLVGLSLFAISLVVARPVALFFGEPAVQQVLSVLAITFVISALQVLPESLLARDLKFRRLALVDTAAALTQAAVTLALAIAGQGYWALVWGIVASRAVMLVLVTAWRPHPLHWPRRLRALGGTLRLSAYLVTARVAWYVYNNADFAVVGRILGKGALGAYSLGWQIASIPVDKLAAVLNRVALPVFSAAQRDRAEVGRYLAALTEGVVLVTVPAAIGMALVADRFVLVVLGEAWRPAILPLRILALYTGLKSVTVLFSNALVAMGLARRLTIASVAAAVVLPVLFVVGTRWGPGGVAAMWFVGLGAVILPLTFPVTLRAVSMSPAVFARALLPASAATTVMVLAVVAVRVASPSAWPAATHLAIEVTAGAAAATATVLLGFAPRVRRYRQLLAEARR